MRLQVKDYLAIGFITVATFPVLYLVMLFATGSARVEFGPSGEDREKQQKVSTIKQSARKDSLIAVNSRTYQALQLERVELEKERLRLREQQDRIDLLQSEVEMERKKISEERMKMEKLVARDDSLSGKKVKDLAKMYSAMRPAEAASILGTMDEALAAKILGNINDDRQKGKILGAFSTDKAARISKLLGGR